MRTIRAPWALLVVACGIAPSLHADDRGIAFFESKIRPLLVEHCYECHSQQSKEVGGGLLLDSRESLLKGGDAGPAIAPGKPKESLLLAAVGYHDESLRMPPKGRLAPQAVADLEAWVSMGAPDPRTTAPAKPAAVSWEETVRQRRAWWSLQPVRSIDPPAVRETRWPAGPVDRFVLARLEAKGLNPAADAPRRMLLRRLFLVLIGLPPKPEQTNAFLADCTAAGGSESAPPPAAVVEKWVDALLASPHFGERWARHWMDVVRFTETHGNEWNYEVHHAWRYRDYLIRAFNDDVPYDQFVREHLAGDLLEKPRWNSREKFNESVIGTAFYRFGEANHDDCIGLRQIGFDLADNQIDTLTKAFQATTVACARCHDHKLDAVSTVDYHALLGVLRSSRLVSHTLDAPEVNAAALDQLGELKIRIRKEISQAWTAQAGQFAAYLAAASDERTRGPSASNRAPGLDPALLKKWLAVLTEKPSMEDPLDPLRTLSAVGMKSEQGVVSTWKQLSEKYALERRERSEFHRTNFVSFADFRQGVPGDWQSDGQGLRDRSASPSGELVVGLEGDVAIAGVLPAGCFTHRLSDKLNGALRSGLLSGGKRNLSFQVMGKRSSALRLVSNNCQLNYKNYRALTFDDLQWITFSPPAERDEIRVYAELMTMLDNPKFPDQLSALGGDPANYRMPWEKAAANTRSHFGVVQAVWHDGPAPPKDALDWSERYFRAPAPTTNTEATARLAQGLREAVVDWAAGKADDADVQILCSLLRRGLLRADLAATPVLKTLVEQYRTVESGLAAPRVAPGIADYGPGFDQPVLVRGEWSRPGKPAPRKYLEALYPSDASFTPAGSGRRELADRIASADNPLTARVLVNRLWHHLFGAGIVRTVDDFGHVGELPSHPELLDYLASRFVQEGWSMKKLIRELALSRTFRLDDRPSPSAKELDPENRLLQHYPARRMEAEAIRDSILAASSRLDRKLYGMSVQPYREKENVDRRLFPGPVDGDGRRSLYIKNNLMEAPKFLGVFNFPGGKVTQGRRDVTNVPAQALALLNDPFVWGQADLWADRLIARSDRSVADRIDAMFETALTRPPRADERRRFEQAVAQLASLHQASSQTVLASKPVWRDAAHAMFNLKEFLYIP